MNRLFAAFFLLSVSLISCTKSEPAVTINPGGINSKSNTDQQNSGQFDGQWQWIGTTSGIFNTIPSVDSPVVLSLDSDYSYRVMISGELTLQGTYSTDTSAFYTDLKFNNIDQPAGDTTSVTVGDMTYLYFNYSLVGRLTIYQNNDLSISGDTLTLMRFPLTPETPVSLFKRIGN